MANDKYLIVVNKENKLDEEALKDYEYVDGIVDSDGKTYIEVETLKAFEALKALMNKKHNIGLSLTSAGRTIQTQQSIYDKYVRQRGKEETEKFVAKPGTSEHHVGLAIDVGLHKINAGIEQKAYNSQMVVKLISRIKKYTPEEKKEMYAKLHQELADFGFVVRYQDGKQQFTHIQTPEPWHIRYVGIENAKEMVARDMCLEEYVEYLKSQENLAG